jgi:polyhydroxybutyrate depolymerase
LLAKVAGVVARCRRDNEKAGTNMRVHALALVASAVLATGLVAGCHVTRPAGGGTSPTAGTFDETLTVGGLQRSFRVHVPASVAVRGGLPVVVALHGAGGNGAQFEQQSQLSAAADREGFVVVYPDGSGRTKLLTWNAGTCCTYARDNGIDDVAFMASLFDALVARYRIDPQRVFVTGFSNGAMLAYRLGCELADRIAAIAPVSGAMNTDTCVPSRALPVLVVHGTADPIVPYDGGPPTRQILPGVEPFENRSVSDAVSFWTGRDRCPPTPVRVTAGAVNHAAYGPCADGTQIDVHTIEGGGHAWPGGGKVRGQADEPPPQPDASLLILGFFRNLPPR